MGPTLRYIGLAVLAGAAWVLVAEEAGWIPAHASEVWLKPIFFSGLALFRRCAGATAFGAALGSRRDKPIAWTT